MMRSTPLALAALAFALAPPSAAQVVPEGRFDIQNFRPSAAPQDLALVQQSRPLANLSVAGGFYFNYSLDPLVLVPINGEQKALSLILNRVQLDAMAVVGLFDWAELGVVAPVVLFQNSDNLQAIGTEGALRSFSAGDIRLTGKVSIPYVRRTSAEKSGLGAALTFGVGFPTGVPDAFAGDGAMTSTVGLVLDYRFDSGLLLAANAGVWLRPEREFAGVLLGSMGSFRIASEIPIVRPYGIMAIAEVSGDAALATQTGVPRQTPAELMLGLRWYSSLGVTLTVGGGGGCACGLGAPAFRTFASAVWVPGRTREVEQLERFKNPPVDPDGDGVIGDRDLCPEVPGPAENNGCPDEDGDGVLGSADHCPHEAGPAENHGCPVKDEDGDGVLGTADRCPDAPGPAWNYGCPEPDRDGDGVVDRLDQCPDDPATDQGRDGCPLARIHDGKIVILEQVHFATDQDIILPESFPTLQEVARILKEHPAIDRVLVEGHTDVRASDKYNNSLSERRAASVRKFLLEQGIAPGRLDSRGFGRSTPIAPNNTDAGMALNRRVEFTILKAAEPKVQQQNARPAAPAVVPAWAAAPGVVPAAPGVVPALPAVVPASPAMVPASAVIPASGKN